MKKLIYVLIPVLCMVGCKSVQYGIDKSRIIHNVADIKNLKSGDSIFIIFDIKKPQHLKRIYKVRNSSNTLIKCTDFTFNETVNKLRFNHVNKNQQLSEHDKNFKILNFPGGMKLLASDLNILSAHKNIILDLDLVSHQLKKGDLYYLIKYHSHPKVF